ncbi:hypothetical protein K438DRAFT_2121465 [Mycena galopus ATCC 62051]|nr:hypothetical protein K438DRAFT_2121465 [Mycena galopus ATCC 62051]
MPWSGAKRGEMRVIVRGAHNKGHEMWCKDARGVPWRMFHKGAKKDKGRCKYKRVERYASHQRSNAGASERDEQEQALRVAERRGRVEVEVGEATEHKMSETGNEQVMDLEISKMWSKSPVAPSDLRRQYEDERRGNERRETMGMQSKTCEVVNTSHERIERRSRNTKRTTTHSAKRTSSVLSMKDKRDATVCEEHDGKVHEGEAMSEYEGEAMSEHEGEAMSVHSDEAMSVMRRCAQSTRAKRWGNVTARAGHRMKNVMRETAHSARSEEPAVMGRCSAQSNKQGTCNELDAIEQKADIARGQHDNERRASRAKVGHSATTGVRHDNASLWATPTSLTWVPSPWTSTGERQSDERESKVTCVSHKSEHNIARG